MKKVFLILVSSLAIFSCSVEDYLSEPQPTDAVSGDKVTPDMALIGMYSAYRDFYGGGHDVATSKAITLGADVMGRDIQTPDFNWYIFEHQWDVTTIPNARRNYFVWDICYKLIFHANTLMYVLEINPGNLSAEDIASYKGQALAMRALAYLDLVRTFQFTYAKDPNAPGVPLDLSVAESVHKPRAPLSAIYSQMYLDLEEALTLLTDSRPSKYRVNLSVAKGIFARVALEKGDYAKAASMASEAKVGYPLMNETTYKAGFNDFTNGEWIWGFPFRADENWGYASFYSFIDHERTAGYQNLYINSGLYDLFSATDYRRDLIVNTGQSFASGKTYRTRKFRDLTDLTGHMVLMRASEMHLIEAEGLAYSNLTQAKNVLLAFQQQRDPSATLSTASSVTDFVEEVLVERRKELYGEIGTDYYDLKRYQKPMLREGNATWNVVGFLLGEEVPATSNRWNMLIPQKSIDQNDALTEADQNPVD